MEGGGDDDDANHGSDSWGRVGKSIESAALHLHVVDVSACIKHHGRESGLAMTNACETFLTCAGERVGRWCLTLAAQCLDHRSRKRNPPGGLELMESRDLCAGQASLREQDLYAMCQETPDAIRYGSTTSIICRADRIQTETFPVLHAFHAIFDTRMSILSKILCQVHKQLGRSIVGRDCRGASFANHLPAPGKLHIDSHKVAANF